MRRKLSHVTAGFTLVELLVVIGVIALLIGILMPVINAARERANRVKCGSNLSQIGKALLVYAVDEHGSFPRGIYNPATGQTAVYTNPYADDPFLAGHPMENDVTAALWVLMRAHGLTANLFVCPSSNETPDQLQVTAFGGGTTTAMHRSNFADDTTNSYSFYNPYPSNTEIRMGKRWSASMRAALAIAADKNPGLSGNEADPGVNALPGFQKKANSANHRQEGQEVLYADGHVEWQLTVYAGSNRDNIFVKGTGGTSGGSGSNGSGSSGSSGGSGSNGSGSSGSNGSGSGNSGSGSSGGSDNETPTTPDDSYLYPISGANSATVYH